MKAVSICLLLGLLLAGGATYAVLKPAAGDPVLSAPSVLVTELHLTPGSLPVVFTAYGSLQPGPGGATTLASQAGGMVASLAVFQGQRVIAGQVLASIAPDAGSVTDAEKAASAAAAAKSNFAHVSALLAAHLATNADLAVAAQTLGDAQAGLAASRATEAGRRRRITAPFNGIVTEILAIPGTVFAAGTPLLRVAAAGGMIAAVSLPPDQAAQIEIGDRAKLALLDTDGAFTATVTGIGAALDPQTGLQPVQLSLDTPPNPVFNAPVTANIETKMLAGYVLPRDAVLHDEEGDFVYQVDAQNIAHRIPVRILVSATQQTLIAAGIDAGLPVVATGAPQLADGMAVRTTP